MELQRIIQLKFKQRWAIPGYSPHLTQALYLISKLIFHLKSPPNLYPDDHSFHHISDQKAFDLNHLEVILAGRKPIIKKKKKTSVNLNVNKSKSIKVTVGQITKVLYWSMGTFWSIVEAIMRLPWWFSYKESTWVQFLGQEDALKKELAAHSSILVWKSPWTETVVNYSPRVTRVKHNSWLNNNKDT